MGSEKLAKFVYGRLKELGIQVKGLVVTGKNIPGGPEEVLRVIEWAKGKDVVVMGMANAGKSTLLNALMDKPQLTSSRYPGTTLDFNPLEIHGVTVYDTPGLTPRNSMLLHLDEEDLKTVLPAKAVKPVGFQLRGDQSFAVGGLCRIDLLGCEHVSAVFYCSNLLELHRGRADKADELWQRHYGELRDAVCRMDEHRPDAAGGEGRRRHSGRRLDVLKRNMRSDSRNPSANIGNQTQKGNDINVNEQTKKRAAFDGEHAAPDLSGRQGRRFLQPDQHAFRCAGGA